MCVNTGVKLWACVAISTVCTLAAGATVYESQAAKQKLSLIEAGRATPGSRISFTPGELNAWVVESAKGHVPDGARNLRLVLGAGSATGYADVDFVRLRRSATGQDPGWLMRNLFSGERPVRVTARFQSREGQARVDVERVEISGVSIEGAALDFAIDAFVRPVFPYAVVSEWFPMQYNIDRFTVNPSGLSVFIRR